MGRLETRLAVTTWWWGRVDGCDLLDTRVDSLDEPNRNKTEQDGYSRFTRGDQENDRACLHRSAIDADCFA